MPPPSTSESSRRARHLYVVEIVLGIAFLGIIAAIVWSNRTRAKSSHEAEEIVVLTAATWNKEVLDSPVPVVVDFWAEWCGPCRMLSPAIDQVAQRYAGKVKVGKLNIDNNEQLTARYGINAIPRVLLFVPGEPPRQIQVFPQNIEASVSSISEAIDSALAKG